MTRIGSIITGALAATLLLTACGDGVSDPMPPPDPVEERFTFGDGFQGWTPQATEIFVGDDDEIDWDIERSAEQATVDGMSVRMFVDNRTDAARLWIDRPFDLEPNTTYDVGITFDFATADWSDVNLWTVLAGAFDHRPQSAEELVPAHRDDTRAGDPSGQGFTWQERSYSDTVATGADGRAWVVVGVWGRSEFPRTYFYDDLRVTFTPR